MFACLFMLAGSAAAQDIGVPYVVDGSQPQPTLPGGDGDAAAGQARAGDAAALPPSGDSGASVATPPGTPADVEAAHGIVPGKPPAFFVGLWDQRRQALAAGDLKTATARLEQILAAKERAGWPDFFAYGDAVVRQAQAAATAGDAKGAARLAAAAVRLAPQAPSTHIALAAATWHDGHWLAAVGQWLSALSLSWSEPALWRVRFGELLLGLWSAMLVAAGALALVMLYRYARLFIHDLRHFLPRGATHFEAWLLGGTVLVTPLLLRLGPAWTVTLWLVLLAAYYSRREHIAAAIAVLLLALTPLVLPTLTRHLAYPGSTAQDLYLTARSLDGEAAAAHLRAEPHPSADVDYALGLRAHWSGQPQQAKEWLDAAIAAGGGDAELFTTLGNVLFALGDSTKAIAAYDKALQIDPKHVVALFNLSRVYYALADHQKAGIAHRRATAVDYDQVEAFSEAAKRAGTGYVVPEVVPRRLLNAPVAGSSLQAQAVAQMWSWIGGSTPRADFAVAGGIALLLIGLFAMFRRYLPLAVVCRRCGLAACRRCNPELPNLEQCGQCYHAFVAPEGVVQQLRIRKEIEAHRFLARNTRIRVAISLLLAGAGQVHRGAALRGMALMTLFVWSVATLLAAFEVLPEPVPSDSALHVVMGVTGGVVALATYAVGLWDGVRERR